MLPAAAMTPRLVLLALGLGASAVWAQERPLPDFDSFIAQVKTRLQTDADLQTGYAFTERRVEQKLDSSGKVKDETVKVYEVYPGLPGDEPYRRLIEENGKPVPPAKLASRDRERTRDVERYVRAQAKQSESDREKAVRAYDKAMRQRKEEIDDIFHVFDVRMVGREAIGGHDTILFSLAPRKNVKARTDSGKMMQHFTARAWISESDFELVRVEVQAVDTLSFGLGILARVQKGATAAFERRKVNDEIWLPAKVTYTGSGRVLLVRRMRLAGYSEFSNYRKFQVDTATTIAAP
jgi:hypothetical protein